MKKKSTVAILRNLGPPGMNLRNLSTVAVLKNLTPHQKNMNMEATLRDHALQNTKKRKSIVLVLNSHGLQSMKRKSMVLTLRNLGPQGMDLRSLSTVAVLSNLAPMGHMRQRQGMGDVLRNHDLPCTKRRSSMMVLVVLREAKLLSMKIKNMEVATPRSPINQSMVKRDQGPMESTLRIQKALMDHQKVLMAQQLVQLPRLGTT
jgi:hypothetical protein